MKVVIVLLLAAVSLGHAEHRGRDYVRDKICQEFNSMGKDNFRSLAIIMNSKKFSNATFEEISHLVKEVVSLAETCCAKGADPSCYETGTNSIMPAPSLSVWTGHGPVHRCGFTHEYSSNYGQAPLPVLVGSIKSYLSMVGTCCISPSPTVCFLKERLERKTLSILTTMSNKICSRYAVYGKEKSKFSTLIMFAQKIPSASSEDLSPLAEDSAEVFSKCCSSMAEDCMQKELSELTTKICTKLSSKDQKFSDCCKGKNLLENYLCMYSLQPAKSPQLPEIQRPTDEQLCTDDGSHQMDQFTFEIARRHTNIPEVFLSKVYDAAHNLVNGCCTAADSIACVSSKRPQLRGEILKFLTKASELCGEYNDLTFLEFKQRLKESFSKTMPDAAPASLTELVERRANFASTCCIMNAPPVYCGLKINAEVGHTCDHDSCMLI
ncbi:Bardet-Biedl syndrome 2 protein-like protein [Platysternon megacephalum]|uniref:Vitamin D-binding protein n=1 Tax=Platysternon megacephalum TaxID=55544 RepID=A0A4D9DWM6_9SAUR|nr:Bardet-Biedl syndrome 2 protein-like protein [Platysternon megacephalum]